MTVRVIVDGGEITGIACTVHHVEPNAALVCVHKDNLYTGYLHPSQLTHRPPMSQQARALLAAWHASNRTLERVDRPNSDNRANINHGYATRRYCTPDLSIDITLTTAVQ